MRSGTRRVLLTSGGVLVVAVAVAGTLGLGGGGGAPTAPPVDSPGTTVRVTRGDMVSSATAEGMLDHGAETPIAMKAEGTVTWLPAEGTVVGRGEQLGRVDDRPVVLLFGDLPAYRDLAEAPAPTPGQPPPPPFTGHDVEQLESNLVALGYGGITVDQKFTAQTAAAVRKWQHHLGEPETGVVAAGDVVYAPGPVRVAKPLVRLGAPANGDILSTTGTTRSVHVDVPVAQADWAVPSAPTTVTLPDGRAVAGVVTSATQEQQQPSGGEQAATDDGTATPTLRVLVDIADQNALGRLDHAQVTITHVTDERDDVLSVPVAALLALAEGGYGLEVVDGGKSRVVAVRTGLFADGKVEVSGSGIEKGTIVRVAQ